MRRDGGRLTRCRIFFAILNSRFAILNPPTPHKRQQQNSVDSNAGRESDPLCRERYARLKDEWICEKTEQRAEVGDSVEAVNAPAAGERLHQRCVCGKEDIRKADKPAYAQQHIHGRDTCGNHVREGIALKTSKGCERGGGHKHDAVREIGQSAMPPSKDVCVEIASEKKHLKRAEAYNPYGCSAAENRQQSASDHRLNAEDQKRSYEDRQCREIFLHGEDYTIF